MVSSAEDGAASFAVDGDRQDGFATAARLTHFIEKTPRQYDAVDAMFEISLRQNYSRLA